MRVFILALMVMMVSINISAQQIEVSGVYAGSNFNKYQNTWGYGISYYEDLANRHRIGLCFQQYFYNREYSDIYPSTVDGVSTFIQDVQPQNKRIVVKFNYSYRIISSPRSSLFLGPEIGLNYFTVSEHVHQYPNMLNREYEYDRNYTEDNKWSFGLFLDFELKEIITKGLSVFLSVHPEIVNFRDSGLEGVHSPSKTRWVNTKIGFRYRLFKLRKDD